MANIAIIETGGKQYKAEMGSILKIEKLPALKKGDKVVFDKVLLTASEKDTKIGTPYLDSKVEGELVEEGRNKKVIVIKYKAKSRYFKKRGHRQPFVKVQITKI